MGDARTIKRLIGIYDADGTIVGELRYVLGRFRGNHCSLCDITHGTLRERADWRVARGALPVDFDALHRNETSVAAASVAADLPAVLAELDDGTFELLVPAAQLDAMAGDPATLIESIRRNVAAVGFRWPRDAPRPF